MDKSNNQSLLSGAKTKDTPDYQDLLIFVKFVVYLIYIIYTLRMQVSNNYKYTINSTMG